MVLFKKHSDPIMGLFVEQIENDPLGRTEVEWCFNLAENPDLAAQYLAWLAEQNVLEERHSE